MPFSFNTFLLSNVILFQDQCLEARIRCEETNELLTMRQHTFERAKERLQLTIMSTPTSTSTMRSIVHNISSVQTSTNLTSTIMSQQPLTMSRRRSYAGNASSPLYSSMAAAFKDKDSHVEEYISGDGLITEDMSDRVVASLPKVLSTDSRLQASRESLRGSCENFSLAQHHNLCKSLASFPKLVDCNSFLDNSNMANSNEAGDGSGDASKHYVRTTSTGTQPDLSEIFLCDHIASAREIAHQRRVMRRIQSAPIGGCLDHDMYNSRLSMITGSTHSIQRLVPKILISSKRYMRYINMDMYHI